MKITEDFVKKYDGWIRHCLEKAGLKEEAFDDIYSKVYERLLTSDNYDPDKGKVTTWLWFVIRSVIRNDKTVRNRSKDALDHAESIEVLSPVIGAEDAGDARDELERIFRRTQASKRDIEIIKKFYIHGYTAKEVAALYRMEQRTVEKVVARTMQALRQAASDEG